MLKVIEKDDWTLMSWKVLKLEDILPELRMLTEDYYAKGEAPDIVEMQ